MHSVPYDGHWRFIVLCAALTRNKLYITDIADFLAQKDTAGGKKTMKAYLWKVCGDAYDAALAGA